MPIPTSHVEVAGTGFDEQIVNVDDPEILLGPYDNDMGI